MNPPHPPITITLGETQYAIRIHSNGTARLIEQTPEGAFPLALLSPAEIETLSYQLHLALNETR